MGDCIFFVAASRKYFVDHPLNLPPLNIRKLLRQYRLHPERKLGQNFLVDASALNRVVDTAEISKVDSVLEIGAGLGSLTRLLANAAGKVVAVEIDPNLIQPLKDVLAGISHVHVVQGDILKLDPVELIGDQQYLVVANIPYYITSALIRHLLEAPVQPHRMVLTVQREVAQRIAAGPGDMSLLSISVQVYGYAKIAAHIPAGAFYPTPKVDSAVVRIDPYDAPLIPRDRLRIFFRLVKAGFSQKRKKLRNALAAGENLRPQEVESLLHAANIEPHRRAETLSIEDWRTLVGTYVDRNF